MRKFVAHTFAAVVVIAAALVAPSFVFAQEIWKASGSLAEPRLLPAAASLADGRVLIVGNAAGSADAVEIHDPATGTTIIGPPLPYQTYAPRALRLMDGRIGVFGGFGDNGPMSDVALYDPAVNSWTSGAPIPHQSVLAPFTILPDGRVVLAGTCSDTGSFDDCSQTDIYNPVTDTWSAGAPMTTGHYIPAFVTLGDGRLLVAGGAQTAASEIYDPVADTWTATAPLNQEDFGLSSAVQLPDGRVVHVTVGRVEIYSPVTDTWTIGAAAPTPTAYSGLLATTGGRLSMLGGIEIDPGSGQPVTNTDLAITQVYDPSTDSWSAGPDMTAPHSAMAIAKRPDGSFVVVGSYYTPNTGIDLTTLNTAPTANAGADVAASTCDACVHAVIVNAGGSADVDDNIVSYEWSIGGSIIATTTQPIATIIVPLGTTTVTLTVRDAFGAEATDTVSVTLSNVEDGWRAQVAALQVQNALLAANLAACQASGGGGSNPTPTMDSFEGYLRSLFGDPAFEMPGATGLDELQQLIAAIKAMPPGQVKQLYRSLGGKK